MEGVECSSVVQSMHYTVDTKEWYKENAEGAMCRLCPASVFHAYSAMFGIFLKKK